MRTLAALLCVLVTVGPAAASPVTWRTITDFGPHDAARLAFRGGLVLRGPRAAGAISALLTEGLVFLAATDTGHFLSGRFALDQGMLVALEDVTITPRRGADGNFASAKRVGDAEALARGNGEIFVYVEAARTLLAYPATGLAVDPDAIPREVLLSVEERRVGGRGMEAMARLGDGSLILIAEGRDGESRRTPGFILGKRRFNVARRNGFAITGADVLPGGDLVIIERRYGGGFDVAMRVRRIGADAFTKGGQADGPVLLEADFSAQIDNMEAIAADVVDGKIVLTLASDNNHSFLQRTLFLRFVVTDPVPVPNPRRRAADG